MQKTLLTFPGLGEGRTTINLYQEDIEAWEIFNNNDKPVTQFYCFNNRTLCASIDYNEYLADLDAKVEVQIIEALTKLPEPLSFMQILNCTKPVPDEERLRTIINKMFNDGKIDKINNFTRSGNARVFYTLSKETQC